VAGRKLIEWAKKIGKELDGNPYGYPRAFTVNPSDEHLETLYDLLEWTWGTREITFCDPMSGGGSIPFEALRYGLTVHANELNPVASVVLKATLDYPARFGPSLVEDIRKFGRIWSERMRKQLERFYPLASPEDNIFAYLWARTVVCPITGKPIPLSPNWWLRKGDEPIAIVPVFEDDATGASFRIVRGRTACTRANPDRGTVRRGSAITPWAQNQAVSNKYIKAEAQAGRMGQQLFAVALKKKGFVDFRTPTDEDLRAYQASESMAADRMGKWSTLGLPPAEALPMDAESWTHGNTPAQYDAHVFSDLFNPRQLLFHCASVEVLRELHERITKEFPNARGDAIVTYLSLAADKCLDYNSRLMRWDGTRKKIVNTFARHDFSFKWSHAEFDASRNLLPWALDQICDAYSGIAGLVASAHSPLFDGLSESPVERLRITRGPAQDLPLGKGTLRIITVDPPYYDNVNYAELADFFYVWERHSLERTFPDFFRDPLTPKDEEAVANPARFAQSRKKRELAEQDYESKMRTCFGEMSRALKDDGVLTVMFTHKRIEAWDTLGTALLSAGFQIDASWPVHTESDNAITVAKKNSAVSTILLACRKREKSREPIWWEDLKGRVRETAREKAEQFERQGISGVDLYVSTFGPVLSIISENWPVLTSETDPKTGDPLPLKPGEALDLARQEVVNLRKRGLLLGRSVEFDPVTDWYLLAWDAFRAQEFPADEARRLALALGLDIEEDLVRDKRLVTKKAASVVLNLPADRRKKGMVDEDAETFPSLIDALHTAMMIHDEEGSKACKVFVDRQGLRTDSRTKALVQAMMEAIPTTRNKEGKFIRPEMTTLDALRMLFWDDLPAPKEEEPPKIKPQKMLAGFDAEEDGDEEEDEEGDDEE
jgi:adenine-specific DNA methylase